MLKSSFITIEKLRSGHFKEDLPEFFELKKFIENNTWHENDSVFNHTLAVLKELEKLMKKNKNNIHSYLSQKIDNHTRRELLFLGALFHDIAKSDTFVRNGNLTSCPNHEKVGSEKAMAILDRLDLTDREKEMVAKIVKYHVEINMILEPGNDKLEEQYEKFKKEHRDIFIELILLAIADVMGSQLKSKTPDAFKFRIAFFKRIIDDY